jgi:hypothetical protein
MLEVVLGSSLAYRRVGAILLVRAGVSQKFEDVPLDVGVNNPLWFRSWEHTRF